MLHWSKQEFIALAKEHTSAWQMGDLWCRRAEAEPYGDDDDFVHLAACELWKRFCPERPSMEMLDDWMQEGEWILREMIRAKPDRARGYVGLADEWGFRPRGASRSPDYARAIALLEQAVAYPVVDGGDWALKVRLEDLRTAANEGRG